MQTDLYKFDKKCKHSTRYANDNEHGPARTVYLMDEWLTNQYGEVPEEVEITVGVPGEPSDE